MSNYFETLVKNIPLIIASFSPLKKKNSFSNRIIATLMPLVISNIDENRLVNVMKWLFLENIIIFIINDQFKSEIQSETIGNDKHKLYLFYVNPETFFSPKHIYLFLNKSKLNLNINLDNTLIFYGFHNMTYKDIALRLWESNIEISSGSNSKKQLLSLNQYFLSQLLFCIKSDPNSMLSDFTSGPFHIHSKQVLSKSINLEQIVKKNAQELIDKNDPSVEFKSAYSVNTSKDVIHYTIEDYKLGLFLIDKINDKSK